MDVSLMVPALAVAASGAIGFARALGARGSSRHYWLIGVGAYALFALSVPFAGLFPEKLGSVAFELQKLGFIGGSTGLALAAIYTLSGPFKEETGTIALGAAALAFLVSLYLGEPRIAVIFHAVGSIGILGLALTRLESHPRSAPWLATGAGLLMAFGGLPGLLGRALGWGPEGARLLGFILLALAILVFAEASRRATR